jgi:hypothetical protein
MDFLLILARYNIKQPQWQGLPMFPEHRPSQTQRLPLCVPEMDTYQQYINDSMLWPNQNH